MYDLVEWTAQQPWSNGNVGMIGISYFAGTQMEAAVERPPHLKAIMPLAGTFDLLAPSTQFFRHRACICLYCHETANTGMHRRRAKMAAVKRQVPIGNAPKKRFGSAQVVWSGQFR
jgi:putative CocE/NonD family hydrolase